MFIRKNRYTIRCWIGSEEQWFGVFKSTQEAHDYLVKNGWKCEHPNERPQIGIGYTKKMRGENDTVGENVCIGHLTRYFSRRKFENLTKPRTT
jgi:hypothetical protein